MGGISSVVRADDVVITQDTTINGCNGVVSTPGSENTDKRLVSGSLEPGGTATFEITYPVDPEDVAGRTEFEITDCVFIEGVAVAKYFIHFVPNTENFILTFTLDIPLDAPVGDEYCNYAKTTAAPSQSQASNRKAGPACFLIGGDLLITKTDESGTPLPGATFDVTCTWPRSTAVLAGTIISASPDGVVSDGNDADGTNDASESFTSTSGGTLSAWATTGSDGTIAVAAPVGTSCTFTETDAPGDGTFQINPDDPDETLVVTNGQQQTHTFVNTLPPAHLTIVKDLMGEVPAAAWAYTGDLGAFTLPAAGGSTSAYELDAGSYTITETTKTGYDVSVSCNNGTDGLANSVTVELTSGEDVTCTFYNVAQSGSITVIKSLDGAAPADAWAYTGDLGSFTLPAGGGQQTFSDLDAGSYDIGETTKDGYAVSVSCDSGESGSASVMVDLDPGEDVICTFLNVAETNITIDKTNDAEVEGQPGAVSRGDTVHFTIEVNITNNDASNVVVTDTLPDGLTYVAGSAEPATTSVSGQVLTWDMGALDMGQYFFEYDATVDNDASGDLTNVGCIDADQLQSELCDDSMVEVTQPSMLIAKDNNAEGPVARGSIVSYTLTVTVSNGPMNDAEITDTLPAGLTYVDGSADPAVGFSVSGQDLTWTVASLGTGSHEFTYDAIVDDDAAIGATLVNTGCVSSADAAEDGLICDDSQIEVKPSTIDFDKSSNFDGESVLRGETIDYTLMVTVTDGPIHNAVVFDSLPDGLTYVDGSANPATGFVADGQDLTWTLGTLASGTYEFTYSATVDADASGDLPNLACVDADETDTEICGQTTIEVRVPTLVIGKDADTETVALLFDAQGNLKSVTPDPVTWTLTWTMTSGPVTNAVITDVLPDGLTYVADSASDGGVYDPATRTLTWTFPSLTESVGTVSFETSTDADAAIGTPIENVAVIDSDETAPDDGRDSITVSEQSEQGSTGTPEPSVPDTASVSGPNGQPVTIPVELLMVLFLASLGTLATVNVRSVRRRR